MEKRYEGYYTVDNERCFGFVEIRDGKSGRTISKRYSRRI
jgi:hypothetical protein